MYGEYGLIKTKAFVLNTNKHNSVEEPRIYCFKTKWQTGRLVNMHTKKIDRHAHKKKK
jgi:hypothetical protein